MNPLRLIPLLLILTLPDHIPVAQELTPPPKFDIGHLFLAPALPPKLEIVGGITDESADSFIKALEEADKQGGVILIPIDSPGGSVEAGIKMAMAIENAENPTRCVVDGTAASMAFYLLQYCDERVMTAKSKLMAHQPFVSGVYPRLNLKELESIESMLRATTNSLAIPAAARMRMSLDYFLRQIDGKDWWMASNDALCNGAVDEVIPPK